MTTFSRPPNRRPDPSGFRHAVHHVNGKAEAEVNRLRRDLVSLLSARPEVISIGDAPRSAALLSGSGLGRLDVAVVEAVYRGEPHMVAAVPYRTWHCPSLKARLLGLKRAAALQGTRLLLVPRSAIRKQPRLSNAKAIAAACALRTVSPEIRERAVASAARRPRGIAIGDFERVAPGCDPIGTALALVGAGYLRLVGDEPITPNSRLVPVSEELAGAGDLAAHSGDPTPPAPGGTRDGPRRRSGRPRGHGRAPAAPEFAVLR